MSSRSASESPNAAAIGDEMEIELIEPTKSSERPRPRVTANELPALMQFGRFDILGRIAFGGMAEIFLGREMTALNASRYLAIKRILPHVADDPAFVEMFLDEARLAMQLNHPNICHIYEFGELDGSYFIAMEWIQGAALGKIIRRARPAGLPFEFSARVIAQIAEALHYAHRARDTRGEPLGIVHRDVSPQNIMVSYEGQVKLLDFGIAKAQSHTTKTQAGVVKGKFSYMSPQQCVGAPVDARADVFALGICLYEILTGEGLYQRPSEYETMRAVIEEPVPSARATKNSIPEELDAIVQKALQKEPADRFQSAAQMQGALEDWLQKAGRAMTATRIADQMQQLFEDQILRGPAVESTPFGHSFQRRVPGGGSEPKSGARQPQEAPAAPIEIPEATQPAPVIAPASGIAPASETVPPESPPATPQSSASRWLPTALGGAALLLACGAALFTFMSRERGGPETTGAIVSTSLSVPSVEVVSPSVPVEAVSPSVPVEAVSPSVPVEGVSPSVPVGARAQRPAAAPATLSINTRPWSRVWMGNRLLGTTPIGEVTVPSGNVRLRIVDRDGRSFARSARVAAGANENLFFDLDQPE